MARRLPAPWKVIEHSESFEIQDANGLRLAFVYFDDREHIGTGFDKPTRDEARRIAVNIARLPQLLTKKNPGG